MKTKEEEILQYIRQQSQKGKTLIRLNQFCLVLESSRARRKIKKQLSVPFVLGYYVTKTGSRKDGWYIKFKGGEK